MRQSFSPDLAAAQQCPVSIVHASRKHARQDISFRKKMLSSPLKGKALILAIAAFITAHGSTAQILLPPEGKGFSTVQKFNPRFIAENRIASVRAETETKKDGDRIRKTHLHTVRNFNKSGKTELIAEIHTKRRDTAITAYSYAEDRLKCEVKNDVAGLFSYCYTYKDGMPEERKYARISRSGSLTDGRFSGKETKITTEKYTHVRYDNQLHTTLYNSAGRPYQKEIRYFDAHGYLLKYLRTFVMTSERFEEVYTYNAMGLLASIETSAGRSDHKTEYTYDAAGNLLTENRFENGSQVYRKEFVYEGADMMLRAELVRRDADEMLEIITYDYSYQ